MNLNKNENIVLIDIDGTLIIHTDKENYDHCLNYYGHKKYVKVHTELVQLLKSYKQRGFYIRVHSNNGYRWAKEVINALDLNSFVDSIETKACRFVDDAIVASNEVVGQHVWIPYEKN